MPENWMPFIGSNNLMKFGENEMKGKSLGSESHQENDVNLKEMKSNDVNHAT